MALSMAERSIAAGEAPTHWARVQIDTDAATYVGRIYVPETRKRLSDLLCDERPFLSLTDVSVNESEHLEAFLAINKQFIRTVRILSEADGALYPLAETHPFHPSLRSE